MKKMICALMIALLLPCVCMAEIDLSGMSYDELIELSKRVSSAMMEHEDFDSVVVPLGLFEVGVDIPEGTWYLSPTSTLSSIVYGTTIAEDGNSIDKYDGDGHETLIQSGDLYKITLKNGYYVEIRYSPMEFTTDVGGYGLGFKIK